MASTSNNVGDKATEEFNALSFERKLVELVEELRLRRNLEVESEKTLKSVLDEKYQEELSWDEQLRKHNREKEDLAQQIELLNRKLEDKVCVSDEDKAKQQVMNKTYSHEIRMLKEELRVSKSEKLNLQKKIQELEGKLKLHDSFQESILSQVSEVRKMMKSNFEENKELMVSQKKLMEDVASAKFMFKKYDLCNQHLIQCVEIIRQKNEALKKELISSRSQITLLKQSVPTKEINNRQFEIEKLQQKVLELENLLLMSRKEKEDTFNNFLESNKLLCKFVDKFGEIDEREKQHYKEVELLQDKLRVSQNELQKTKDEIKDVEQKAILKEKKRIENQCSTGMQTEDSLNECYSCSEALLKSSDNKVTTTLASFIPKAMDENFMDEFRNGLVNLQQNALLMQSEMSVKNGVHSFSLDQLCVNSADKKITLSQVLKRKFEIMNSGDPVEMIMKKRFTENASQSVIVVENGVEGSIEKKMISHEANNLPLFCEFNKDIPFASSSVKPNMLLSRDTSAQPLFGKFSEDIPAASSSVKPKMLSHDQDIPFASSSVKPNILLSRDTNAQPLFVKFSEDIPAASSSVKPKMLSHDQDIPFASSSVKPNMLLSPETNAQPLFGKFSEDIPAASSSVKPKMLSHDQDIPFASSSVKPNMLSPETNAQPLFGKFNEDIPAASSSVKPKMLSHDQDIPFASSSVKPNMLLSPETNAQPLFGKFNEDIPAASSSVKPKMLSHDQDIPFASSSVKPNMLLSPETNAQPLFGKFSEDIPAASSSVKPKMLSHDQDIPFASSSVKPNMLSPETNAQPLFGKFNEDIPAASSSVKPKMLSHDQDIPFASSSVKPNMLLSPETNAQPLFGKFSEDIPAASSSVKPKMLSHDQDIPFASSSVKPNMLLSRDTNAQPLFVNFSEDIPAASSSVKPKMMSHDQDIPFASSSVKPNMLLSPETNAQPLFGKFNEDIPAASSIVKPKILSHETNGLSLCSNLNQDILLCQPPVDIRLDQKYLTYKKFSGKISESVDDVEN